MVAGIQAVVAVELSRESVAGPGTSEEVVHGHRKAPNLRLDNFRDHHHGVVLDHFVDGDRQRARARRLAPGKRRE